ncbi:hypothetical protein [Gordonia sp. 'Campus']|uniref:hypothetical protein n=1 Tax=Gordonia sp. 'Campus' TaxID=2915824 RepID=UPI001EE42EEC|nr:hypothetical protein [Gordonia sp. 'Campus']
MTENNDGVGPTNRVAPKRSRATMGELTLIVRPPGRPADVRVYTDDEATEAQTYATEVGGQVERLP